MLAIKRFKQAGRNADGLLLFGSDRDLRRVRLSGYFVVSHCSAGTLSQLTVDLCLGVTQELEILGWRSQQQHRVAQSKNTTTGAENLCISRWCRTR